MDPCLPRGPREPPEGLGRGQGAGADRGAVRAQTWQEDEGKELLHCRGGARSQHGQGKGALPALGPTWGWGLWGKEVGAEGAKGLSYLAGRGLGLSSPPGGMVGGGRLDPQRWRGGAEVKVLPGDQQSLEAQGERGDREEERGVMEREAGAAGEWRGAQAQWAEGTPAQGGCPLPSQAAWVFLNANSMLFTFHLNLRCCYKLSTRSCSRRVYN